MNFRNILTPASLPGKGWRRNELHLPNLALLVSPVVAQRAESVWRQKGRHVMSKVTFLLPLL